MTTITVREYARLTTKAVRENTLDRAQISPSAFAWLCDLQAKWRQQESAFIDFDGARTVRLNNYVGILESPCNTCIEVLPKTHLHTQDVQHTRALLWRMLCIYLGKDTKEADLACLKCMNKPLNEWLIYTFLQELSALLKQGLHAQYNKVHEERAFIRGQIHMARQMRQPVHRQHLTHVCHTIFTIDRPENRLLRTALHRCLQGTRDAENWTLAATLEGIMQHVAQSRCIAEDFLRWQHARHMTQYRAIKPWCELILHDHLPTALQGGWQGISLLFPMEKVFETFVVHAMRAQLRSGVKLTTQASRKYLCTHQERKMFALRPDILLESKDNTWIADAKWKCLDPTKDKYDISQADMYQLFAYGHQYMGGVGEMALIFPRTESFHGIESPFYFRPHMKLYVVACDLEAGTFFPEGQEGACQSTITSCIGLKNIKRNDSSKYSPF